MSQFGSFSTFTYGGVAGLSLASVFALFKLWKHTSKRRHELVSRDMEIAALRESLNAAALEAETKEGTLSMLRKELEESKGQLDAVNKLLRALRDQNQTLAEQITRRTEELELSRDESRSVKEKYSQTVLLLDTRTQELRGAEAFLTKADTLSGAEVISMLNGLNSEIYQTAALVAESFQFQPKAQEKGKSKLNGSEGHDEGDMAEVYQSATDILGSRMVELLRSSDHHEDPTLVQIAFQAGMAAYSNWIISAWDFEDPDDERLLGDIYSRLRLGEGQTISGRWRALTRAYVRQNDQEHLAMYFVDAFVNILLTAGARQTQKELQDLIASRFTERINLIVRGAQAARKAVGEDITSCDYEIIFVPQDRMFDPSKMDDTLAPDSNSGSGFEKERNGEGPETVLCTTDLGLLRSAKIRGKVSEWEQAIVLRPKVVLQSGIDEVIAQPAVA